MEKREILEKRIIVLKRLRKELNGSCGDACPGEISGELYGVVWRSRIVNCGRGNVIWSSDQCNKYFLWLKPSHKVDKCPCYYGINSDIILLRLDEVIDEIADELRTIETTEYLDEM